MDKESEWTTICKKQVKKTIYKNIPWKITEDTIEANIETLVKKEIPYISLNSMNNKNLIVEWKTC